MKKLIAGIIALQVSLVSSAFAIKTDPVLNPQPVSMESFSQNLNPIIDMALALQKKGAKVSSTLVETKYGNYLNISIDGQKLQPILIECLACEVIVFEY